MIQKLLMEEKKDACTEVKAVAKVFKPMFSIEGISTIENIYPVPGTDDFIVNSKIYVCFNKKTAFDMSTGVVVKISFKDYEEELCKKVDKSMDLVSKWRGNGDGNSMIYTSISK